MTDGLSVLGYFAVGLTIVLSIVTALALIGAAILVWQAVLNG